MRELSCLKNTLLRRDASCGQVVRRHFHHHLVAGQEAGRLSARLARHVRNEAVAVWQFHQEKGLFQHFHYGTFNFDGIFSRHVKISGSDMVTRTVCSKWADSEPSWVT